MASRLVVARLPRRSTRRRQTRALNGWPGPRPGALDARLKRGRYSSATEPMATPTQQFAEAPVPHHWTLDEYHRAIDAGVFADRRVELLNGEIVEMPPMNEPHIGAVRYLAGLFFAQLGWQRASSQTPIILPSD